MEARLTSLILKLIYTHCPLNCYFYTETARRVNALVHTHTLAHAEKGATERQKGCRDRTTNKGKRTERKVETAILDLGRLKLK